MNLPTLEWLEPEAVIVPPELQQVIGGHPLAAELLVRRRITDPGIARAFLDPDLYHPADPLDLPDLAAAADRLELALQRGEKIGVWGDFDVDGQTSTALLVSGLRSLGGNIIYHIPVRARESHGINLPNLEKLLAAGAQLVLTCDTGITAHEAAEYLRNKQVDLLITDHHSLPEQLPAAPAVVNPQRLPSNHPLRPLCGVGTAAQLLAELLRRKNRSDEFSTYLDLVALGTVADLAALTGDNRRLVQRGLQTLRAQPRPGLQAVLKLAELPAANLNEEHIGFILAPRLNAIGRLGDANPMVELLITPDLETAKPLALELEALNSRRKRLCDDVFRAAQSQIERNRSLLDAPVLVLDNPTWPAGVVGIVASRLVELYARPVALIAAPPGEIGRASARSVDGINITAALAENANLLLGFGGHPMAAGFSIQPEKINDLRRALSRSVLRQAAGKPLTNRLQVDAWLSLPEINLDLVESIDRLAPFGPGNPSPVFAARNLRLESSTGLGRTGEHLQLVVEDPSGNQARIIWWGAAGNPLPGGRFDLAYTVRASNFRGQVGVTIEWVSARPLEESAVEVTAAPAFSIADNRQISDPQTILSELELHPDSLFWWEADCPPEIPGTDRNHLRPAHTLVIASIPPERAALAAALQQVQPQRVILLGHVSTPASLRSLLTRMGGLIRGVQSQHNGITSIEELAAACASTNAAIRSGLAWWQANGAVHLDWLEDSLVQISSPGQPSRADLPSLESQLNKLLAEQEAFREYYRRAPLNSLLEI